MIKFEEIKQRPTFSNQLENKVLLSDHADPISISYQSTYSLKYVIEGEKRYRYDKQDISVQKGQFVILNNSSKVTTEVKKGTKGLSLFLSEKLIKEIYGYHTFTKHLPEFIEVPQKRASHRIGFLLGNITQLLQYPPLTYKEQIEQLFIQVSELIIQEQINVDAKFSTLKIIKQDTKRELLHRVSLTKEFLNDHKSDQLSLDKISKHIGISKYYLHRLFSEIYGMTPLEYLSNIRIKDAKNKLRYTKRSVSQIAFECGFDSAHYFSYLFKKRIGASPTQFRATL